MRMRPRPNPLSRAVRVAAGRGAGIRDVALCLGSFRDAPGCAGLKVDFEYPLQSLCPCHRRVAIYWRFLRARRVTPSATGRGHLLTQMMVGGASVPDYALGIVNSVGVPVVWIRTKVLPDD